MTANSANNEPCAGPADLGYRVAVGMAAVAGVFSALVCVLLLVDYSKRQFKDPSEAEAFLALKARLAEEPESEELKNEVRSLDLQLRRQYFQQRRFAEMGGWLLLGGVLVFLAAAKSAATLRRKLPMPEPQGAPHDVETPMTGVARWSIGVLAVVLVGTTVVLIRSYPTELASLPEPQGPAPESGQLGQPSGEPRIASDEEIGKSWPRFRGPGGLGLSAYPDAPTAWDGNSGEGIVWKTPVPLPGVSSAVVYGGRVFLSGATEVRRQMYCFDAAGGKLLWEKDVPTKTLERPDPSSISDQTGYAAPSAATDGSRVFAMFANGDVAAFDFSGNLVWSRSLGIPDNHYGHAASPIVYRNLVLIQFDQSSRAKDEKSKLLALDAATGETVYEVPRPSAVSWTTPAVMHHEGGDQLITCGDPLLIAYNPSDGSEIWRAEVLGGEIGPSPVFVNGVVYVACEYSECTAIRADGKGDVTESHVVWTAYDGLPDTCSPLVTPEYLFLLASFGTLTCYDCQTGDVLWEMDFDANFTSSPGWCDGRVYLFGEEGKGWIVEPGREEGKVVAETDLGEACFTSPAFQEGRIYIRGEENLFCLGGK